MTSRWTLLCIFASAAFLIAPAFAQVNNSQNVGLPPNATFEGSDIESVQVNNGNLHVEIPMFSLSGRGLPVRVSYVLDTKGWWGSAVDGFTHIYAATPPTTQQWWLGHPLRGGITLKAPGHQQCSGVDQPWLAYTYTEENGTSHSFPPIIGGSCDNLTGNTIYANDGSGYAIQFGTNYTKGIRKDGVSTYYDGSRSLFVMEDTNGNQITQANGGASTITDTLGRSINTAFVGNELSYYDSNGAQQTIVVTKSDVVIATNLCDEFPDSEYCVEYNGHWSMPTEIDLPNGMKYIMTYNNGYGTLKSITLPTGAKIEYTYGTGGSRGYASACQTEGAIFDTDDSGPRVTSRKITNGSQVSTWTYTYICGTQAHFPAPTTATDKTVVTSPTGDDTVHSLTHYVDFNSQLLGNALPPSYETQADYFAGPRGGNQILKTVVTEYQDKDHGPHMPIRVTSFWPAQGNLVSKVETDWDMFDNPVSCSGPYNNCFSKATWGNTTNKKDFDFGVGSPGGQARSTHFDYAHHLGDTNYNSNYTSLNIANRLTEKRVYQGTSNTAVADTKMYYDGTTATQVNGIVNHETLSTNFRGNLTKTSVWRNLPAAWLDTINTYNDLGHMLTTKDPALNVTSFDYTDSWSGGACGAGNAQAFLTTATRPATNVSHISKNKYYACTGQVQSTQDENDTAQSRAGTIYTYDPMLRPLTITRSDSATYDEEYVYDDTPNSVSVTKKVLRDASNNFQTTVSLRDGLGRETSAQLTSDPDGADKVDTIYDANGRKYKVSIPYRGTPTTYVTKYLYDALDRIQTEVPPDGSDSSNNISTVYGSNSTLNCLTTTVTDQASKIRTSCVDALGHLIAVFEGAGTTYETDYQYDVLDNLISVTQKGGSGNSSTWRTRSFGYDSLSRLTSATNPESGNILYSYVATGNALCAGDLSAVCSKTAPAPNQTGSLTLTMKYSYDVLNRPVLVDYSDTGAGATPDLMWGYDQSNITMGTLHFTISNSIGRLSWSAPVDTNAYPINMRAFSYDTLGRVVSEWEEPDNTDLEQRFDYVYNPDGSMKTLKYPSGRTLTFTVSGAGRTTEVKDIANGINYVTAATYDAAGNLLGMKNGVVSGGFSGITTTNTYTSKRLQPSLLSAATSGGTIFSLTYDFQEGIRDNGDVYKVTNNLDNNRTQNLTYDSFNRIATAYTTGSNWGEDFTIDPWGNLTARALHSGKTNYEPLSQIASVKNQLTGFAYDSAGNITSTNASSFYTYNADNQLVSLDNILNPVDPIYFYNAEGQRVKKTIGASGTVYTYGAGGAPLVESDLAGNVLNEYVFFNGTRIARRIGSSGVIEYYFSDHLGSASVITDSNGVVLKQADYYPYGGEIAISGGDANKYKFTGKERDPESGLDNFGARYYWSNIGRFMTPDWAAKPIAVPYANYGNPQSLNLYAYVKNNPTTLTDPDGHVPPDGLYHGGDGGFAEMGEIVGEKGEPTPTGGAAGPAQTNSTNASQKPHKHQSRAKSQRQVAGTIYNETSTLRPSAKTGAGSAKNLHDARVAMAQVLEVNHSKEKVAPSAVHDNLKNSDAAAAMKDSRLAAAEATTAPDGTNGATHFYLDASQPTKQDWYNQGEIEESFGPFTVNSNTREFKAGEEVDIEIIVSPVPKK